VRELLRDTALGAFRALNRGTRFECPCCDSEFARFLRRDTERVCPRCRSIARNRVLVLYLSQRPQLLRPGARVLHLAPEPAVHGWLSARDGIDYTTGDLDPGPLVQRRFDAHELPFDDRSFDLILCSHVLEHVRDDVTVTRELGRVLAPSGEALLQIPVDHSLEVTDDDPSVDAPAERLDRFGQRDHVRRHGRDAAERLARSGLQVDRIGYEDLADEAERARYILTDRSESLRSMRSADVYRCRHPLG
jgi:SAM-dependent methyltransferase